MSPSPLASLVITLLVIVCARGTFPGGPSSWRPYYGSYAGRPGRGSSQPLSGYGPPKDSHGSSNSFHSSHRVSASYGPPSTVHSVHSVSGTFSRPTTIHGSHSVSTSHGPPTGQGSHGVTTSHGPPTGQGSHGVTTSHGPPTGQGSHGVSTSYSPPTSAHGSHSVTTSYSPPTGVHGSHSVTTSCGHSHENASGQHGHYHSNSCATFIACSDDKACPSSQYCADSPHLPHCGRECLPDLPNTYDCERDYQCRSNYCDPTTHKCQLRPSPPNPCKDFMTCRDDKQCSADRFCAESPHLPQCGHECLPDFPNTYDCERDYQCRSNYCDPNTLKCQLRPNPPDPCKGFMACQGDEQCPADRFCGESPHLQQCGHECLPDLPNTYSCDRDYQCRSNYCDSITKVCRDKPSPPDPCAGFIACQGDESCSVIQHCAPSPLRPHCGSECVPDLPNMAHCQRDNQCLSGYCHTDQYVCKPQCYDFHSCYSDTGCAPSEHCSLSKTQPECGKECQPDYPDMTHSCDRNKQCQSGYCDPAVGQCNSPCADLVLCSDDFECALNEHCAQSPTQPICGNECVPDLPDMTSCERHDECLSDFCEPTLMQCKPRDTPPPQPCCLFGFLRLGDSCYEVQRTKFSYDEARTFCATNYNGDLSTVPSQEVNDLVTMLLDQVGATSAWVGINDQQTEGVFEDVNGAEQLFTQWASGRPQKSRAKNCVEVSGNGFSDDGQSISPGKWNDQRCNEKRSFVCQTPVFPICPKAGR